MTAKAHELQKSRALRFDGRNPGTSFEYLVTKAADAAAVLAALVAAECPYSFSGFTRQAWDLRPLGGGVWEASVPFGAPDPADPPALFPGETPAPEVAAADPSFGPMTDPTGFDDPFGDYPADPSGATGGGGNQAFGSALGPEWSFDTSGGTHTVRTALLDAKRGGVASRYFARVGGTAKNFKGLIGVKEGDGKKLDVEGIEAPQPKLEIGTTRNLASVSLKYILLVARLTGTVNKTPFIGAKAGELLFLGASGQYKPPSGQQEAGGWSVGYKWAFNPNQAATEDDGDGEGLELAPGVFLPPGETKEGWDLLDVNFEEWKDPDIGLLVPRASQFAVHRIFPRADHRFLGFKNFGF